MQRHRIIADKIVAALRDWERMNFFAFRILLYDIFIYHLDVAECVWYILRQLELPAESTTEVLIKTYQFFRFYNNNYRQIFHLERYFLSLTGFMPKGVKKID